MDFPSITTAMDVSPLAYRLFMIDGVERVFFGKDYISVTTDTSESAEDAAEGNLWIKLKPDVSNAILHHYEKDLPILSTDIKEPEDLVIHEDDEEHI